MFGNFQNKKMKSMNMDAWSDGQIGSKLWLCRAVENFLADKQEFGLTIWIYGSWYGSLAFLLLSRERLNIKKICCFDLDRKANRIAEKILDHWKFQNVEIRIYEQDCLDISPSSRHYIDAKPDIIINTSCEHMINYNWWHHIPPGLAFALQTTDMPHPTHINLEESLPQLQEKLGGHPLFQAEEKIFSYPNLRFKRFMVIGVKHQNVNCGAVV